MQEIYYDAERYLTKKIKSILKIDEIYNNKDKVESYFNKILGQRQIIFHGTTSTIEKYFVNNLDKNYVVIEPCLTIDNIYQKHGIYKAFQSGVKDFNDNNFWVTSSPSSACFYSLQSPEYFARFASSSDYYKQDIYKYDRIAYYRKDYKACYNNLKKEMKEFCFSKQEKEVVYKNFKIMWNIIVFKDMKSVIFYKEIEAESIHHFVENEKLMDLLLKYFTLVHFKYNFSDFKQNINKIVLLDVKNYLKRQHPVINQKFVIINNKRYIPDFYGDCKYSTKKYYTFKNDKCPLTHINKDLNKNSYKTLIELVNEAKPNTYLAKKVSKQSVLPTISDVIQYYKHEFKDRVEKLQITNSFAVQASIVKEICEDIGLKYVCCLKYNQYFKDINLFCIYQYNKYLGIKMFEHYDGFTEATSEKINKLIYLYNEILSSEKFILEQNISLKLLNDESEVVK